jgi:hypothetical protein
MGRTAKRRIPAGQRIPELAARSCGGRDIVGREICWMRLERLGLSLTDREVDCVQATRENAAKRQRIRNVMPECTAFFMPSVKTLEHPQGFDGCKGK